MDNLSTVEKIDVPKCPLQRGPTVYTLTVLTYTHSYLCHCRQVDQRKVVHKTSTYSTLSISNTAHLQSSYINDASPFPLTNQTNLLFPTTSATANNGAITKVTSHETSQLCPFTRDVQLYSHTFNQSPRTDALGN